MFSIYTKIFFAWLCFTSVTHGMSHKIEKSFKLIFWGIEVGELIVKAEISNSHYNVSSIGSAKGVVSLFSSIVISSGAVGSILDGNELAPSQSSTRWHYSGELKQTRLLYSDRKLTHFFHSPELKKPYHIIDPVGLDNSIDPVSMMLWFLMDYSENELCRSEIIILDGFRMSELSFLDKINDHGSIMCNGVIRRVSGFKEEDLKKAPLNFKSFYEEGFENQFRLSRMEIETIFGKMVIIEDARI